MPKVKPKTNAKQPPKLVNRGAAGLLTKVKGQEQDKTAGSSSSEDFLKQLLARHPDAKRAKVVAGLKPLVVDIDTLVPDPDNARLHPERNLEAIMLSLAAYGQRTPLVVNKKTMHVEKGNGTMEAAKTLGWRKIAAVFVDDDPATAAGYGLADNRSAELARWDFEVVAKLDQLVKDCGGSMVGWTADEIAVLRGNVEEYQPIQGGQTWEELWQGMPEFTQEDQTSFKSIVVHFKSEEDFLEFLQLVGQEPGDVRQKSIWHPKAEIGHFADKRYVSTAEDEEQEGDELADEQPARKRRGK